MKKDEKIYFFFNVFSFNVVLRLFRGLQPIKAADGMDFSMLNLDKEAFKKTAWLNEQEEDFVVWRNILYLYQGNATELTAADFPKVEYLSAYLFKGNENLTSVALPNGYQVISMYCFSGCVNLTKVSLPLGNKNEF